MFKIYWKYVQNPIFYRLPNGRPTSARQIWLLIHQQEKHKGGFSVSGARPWDVAVGRWSPRRPKGRLIFQLKVFHLLCEPARNLRNLSELCVPLEVKKLIINSQHVPKFNQIKSQVLSFYLFSIVRAKIWVIFEN